MSVSPTYLQDGRAGKRPSLEASAKCDRVLQALIIEDDPLARDLLRSLLMRTNAVRVVGEAGTMAEGEAALARTDYDVVFLDIQLLGGSGLDLVPLARPAARIIFVTAHDEHALRAFRINAADYILKPPTVPRLVEAIRRAAPAPLAPPPIERRFAASDSIFLRGAAAGGRFVSVQQIAAIVSSENYSEVLLVDGERWFIRRTMQAWEEMLPADAFARVRRTAIVNLGCIERIERDLKEKTTVILRGVREPLAVGRRIWPRLKARLDAKLRK